jgi:hypothetical protein
MSGLASASLKPGRSVSLLVTPTWWEEGVIETVGGLSPAATSSKIVL